MSDLGLCSQCKHVQVVKARSRFYLCTKAAHDEKLTRYPRLPVLQCHAFKRYKHGPKL